VLIGGASVLIGVAAILLGLLFLVGNAGLPHRFVVAVLGLLLGALCVGWGLRILRRARRSSPEQLQAEILELARQKNGELSRADLASALGLRTAAAEPLLAQLIAQRICLEQRKEGAVYYLFPELQPRLTVRRCEFCDAELALDDQLASCPRCGGSVRTQVERRSLSEASYNMDEPPSSRQGGAR
jgi:hypothetical protein